MHVYIIYYYIWARAFSLYWTFRRVIILGPSKIQSPYILYINKIIKHMIHRLQNKGINSIARVEQIFNPKNMIPDDIKYGEKDIQVVSEEVGVTNVGDVVSEWKIFRNYLKSYSCNNAMNATDILAKLASASDISYGFPLLADIWTLARCNAC